MSYERRNNWIRHHGRRPSATAFSPWRDQGPAVGLAPSAPGKSAPTKRATQEAGLAIIPSSRYRSILVPVDGSSFGEHALPLALGIARRAGAELRVMHVHSPMVSTFQLDQPRFDSGLDHWLKRPQEKYLDDLVQRLSRFTSIPITPVFRKGPEVADLLCEAASSGTDLVVMATHGRGPFGRFLFGSVGDTLMQRLSVPLLFVQGNNVPVDLAGDPILRHVLVTLDGSEAAEQILEPALALGSLTGADHTLLRIVPWVTDFSSGYMGPETLRSPTETDRTEAWSYVQRVAKRLEGETARVHPRLVLDEASTVQAILRHAQVHDADLVALATRGQGGLLRFLQGSVADQVIRSASVPVLVHRQYRKSNGG